MTSLPFQPASRSQVAKDSESEALRLGPVPWQVNWGQERFLWKWWRTGIGRFCTALGVRPAWDLCVTCLHVLLLN